MANGTKVGSGQGEVSPSTDHGCASPSCLLLWGRVGGGVILALFFLVLLRVQWLLLHRWQGWVYCLGEVGNRQQSEGQGWPEERVSYQPTCQCADKSHFHHTSAQKISLSAYKPFPFLREFHFCVSWTAKQAKLVAWGRWGMCQTGGVILW